MSPVFTEVLDDEADVGQRGHAVTLMPIPKTLGKLINEPLCHIQKICEMEVRPGTFLLGFLHIRNLAHCLQYGKGDRGGRSRAV